MVKRLFHINWKKGAGEMIAITLSMVILFWMLIFIFASGMLNSESTIVDDAARKAARIAVACDSMDNARTAARRSVEKEFENNHSIKVLHTDVVYAPGSDSEWKKGNFIVVTVYAESTFLGQKKETTADDLAMIERNEGV